MVSWTEANSATSTSIKLSYVRAAGVCLPLLSKRVRWFATDSIAFVVGRAFAAGVVLATGFVHLFPDAYENLTDPCLGWGGARSVSTVPRKGFATSCVAKLFVSSQPSEILAHDYIFTCCAYNHVCLHGCKCCPRIIDCHCSRRLPVLSDHCGGGSAGHECNRVCMRTVLPQASGGSGCRCGGSWSAQLRGGARS